MEKLMWRSKGDLKLNIYTVLNTLHYIRYDLCSLQERAEVSAESGYIAMVVSVLRLYSASFSNIFYIKSYVCIYWQIYIAHFANREA